MLDSGILDYFYLEGLFITYFIILVLGFELSLFFVFQHVHRRGLSPRWMLSFSITLLAFTIAYLLRAVNDLVSEASTIGLFYQIDIFIISVSSIATGYLMLDFFKRGKPILRSLAAGCVVLGACSTIADIIAFIAGWEFPLWIIALGGIAFLVVILFPMYLLIQLAKREESGLKKLFYIVFIGEIIIFLGMMFNFKLVDNEMQTLFPDTYGTFKVVILAIIIVGLAVIGLGFFYLPPVDDFFWGNDLVALYILDKSTRMTIFKIVFDAATISTLAFANKENVSGGANEDMFLGGIGGISDMLSETLSGSKKRVELIDQGAVKLILSYEGDLIFLLLAKRSMPILTFKLKSFKETFMLFYGDLVKRFASNPEKFLPVEKIATRIFKTAAVVRKKEEETS
jgi:hypothetical protein